MSSEPAGTEPMTDERPTGVLQAANDGRSLHATLAGTVYARHPVRTHLVTAADDAADGRRPLRRPDRRRCRALVAVSERMVAITQGRSYPISEIRARPPRALPRSAS